MQNSRARASLNSSLVFAIAVCILFALYPARKASKLDPVKALRYE